MCAAVHKKVYQLIERFMPEVNSYKKRLIFTPKECVSILDQRKKYELKLLRNKKISADFLLYIKAELRLKKKRDQRMLKANEDLIKTDLFLERNIFSIYKRAFEKFNDPSLIKAFADFCIKVEMYSEMKEVLMEKCMKISQNQDLWIFSGKRIFQVNDIEGAREFFIKGISLCSRSSNDSRMFIEFFKVEIEHIKKIERFNRENEIYSRDTENPDLFKYVIAVFDEFKDKATHIDIKECILAAKGYENIVKILKDFCLNKFN